MLVSYGAAEHFGIGCRILLRGSIKFCSRSRPEYDLLHSQTVCRTLAELLRSMLKAGRSRVDIVGTPTDALPIVPDKSSTKENGRNSWSLTESIRANSFRA